MSWLGPAWKWWFRLFLLTVWEQNIMGKFQAWSWRFPGLFSIFQLLPFKDHSDLESAVDPVDQCLLSELRKEGLIFFMGLVIQFLSLVNTCNTICTWMDS